MKKINSIKIKNYKSCINTEIKTKENLTVLIGVNGVGKTNILNSIKLLKKIFSERYRRDTSEKSMSRSETNVNLTIDEDTYKLKIIADHEINEFNIDEIYPIEISFQKNKERKKEKLDSNIINELYYKLGLYPQQIKMGETFNNAKRIIDFISSINYYGATQFSDPSKYPVSIEFEEYTNKKSLNYDQPYKVRRDPHYKFIYDLFLTYKNKRDDFEKYLNIINKKGIGLIDDIKFLEPKLPTNSYEIISGGEIKEIQKTKKIIIPLIKLDGLSLSLNQLSEGTLKTLALIFYIINDQSSVLLIEEPEVCVHHGLLSSIVELIKIASKEKQIILSTHSDFVLDKVKPENILLINKDKEEGTIARTLDKALSTEDYKALKQYLENSGNLGEYWREGGLKND
jgi:predicted ATP-dependent endonuclease of OLD family